MSTLNKLQITLSEEGMHLSTVNEFETKELFLKWDNQENFSMIMENTFQLHLIDLQEIDVHIINQKFLLTPNEYYSSLFISSYLEKAIGQKQIENCEMHHQEIAKEDSMLSFYIPSSWKDYLAIRFPLSTFHYKHFLGNLLIQTSKFLRNQMHVWIENKSAFVILRKNGRLQIANVYPCKDAIELAFYLHSIRESFDFVWTNDTFSIQGKRLLDQKFKTELIGLSIPFPIAHEQA